MQRKILSFHKFIILATICCIYHSISYAKEPENIVFAGGDKDGVFHSIASAFCTVINRHYKDQYHCNTITSKGAQDNLSKVIKEKVDFAITKPFDKYSLFLGDGNLKDIHHKKFLSIFTLHQEHFSFLVHKDSNISKIQNIHNKKISIGNDGSASNIIIRNFLNAFNYHPEEINNNSIQNSIKELCNHKIDAMLYYIGHPNTTYANAIKNCNLELISLSKKDITKLLMSSEYHQQSYINKSYYPTLQNNINTISSPAILVAKKNIHIKHIKFLKEFVTLHKGELIKIDPIFKQIEFLNLHKYNNIPQ